MRSITYLVVLICLSNQSPVLNLSVNSTMCTNKKFPAFLLKPFKRQHHKIIKHTQTICRLLPTSCLRVFDNFVGLALKGLKIEYCPALEALYVNNFVNLDWNNRRKSFCGKLSYFPQASRNLLYQESTYHTLLTTKNINNRGNNGSPV